MDPIALNKARQAALSPARRREIASNAARCRWRKADSADSNTAQSPIAAAVLLRDTLRHHGHLQIQWERGIAAMIQTLTDLGY